MIAGVEKLITQHSQLSPSAIVRTLICRHAPPELMIKITQRAAHRWTAEPDTSYVAHKRTMIEASEILQRYWQFLRRAIDESAEIVLFGYSGNNTHLHQMIAQKRSSKSVGVVAWLGAGFRDVRQPFWDEQLGGEVKLLLKEDVLTFTD